MGEKGNAEGTVIYTPMMESTAKTCIKATLSEDIRLGESILPNLDYLFYSKLCHYSVFQKGKL